MHMNKHGWLCVSEDEAELRVQSSLFKEVALCTQSGGLVVRVIIPKYTPPVKAIQWGSRFFFRDAPDRYMEDMLYAAPMVVQNEGDDDAAV